MLSPSVRSIIANLSDEEATIIGKLIGCHTETELINRHEFDPAEVRVLELINNRLIEGGSING